MGLPCVNRLISIFLASPIKKSELKSASVATDDFSGSSTSSALTKVGIINVITPKAM